MRLAVTLIFAGCAAAPLAPGLLAVGPKAPDFLEPAVDGREVSLAALEGKVVMLHFWAKWCGACEGDLEIFQDLYEKYDVAVVGFAHASGPDQDVIAFAEMIGVDFPNVQATEELRTAYPAAVFPTTIVVDRAGHIRYRASGRLNPGFWDRLVEDLLEEGS